MEQFNFYNVFQQLINFGNVDVLYKLSQTNKNIKDQLYNRVTLLTLLYVTNLNKYYNIDNIGDFSNLYIMYKTLNDKKDIYNHIKKTFTRYDFKRARGLQIIRLVGNITSYNVFLKYQWEILLIMDNIKKIKTIKYIIDFGRSFGLIDKDNMIPTFSDGMVFDIGGNLCFTSR